MSSPVQSVTAAIGSGAELLEKAKAVQQQFDQEEEDTDVVLKRAIDVRDLLVEFRRKTVHPISLFLLTHGNAQQRGEFAHLLHDVKRAADLLSENIGVVDGGRVFHTRVINMVDGTQETQTFEAGPPEHSLVGRWQVKELARLMVETVDMFEYWERQVHILALGMR